MDVLWRMLPETASTFSVREHGDSNYQNGVGLCALNVQLLVVRVRQ